MTKTNLIAVQARMERDDYRDEAAFNAKIRSLMELAAREADFSLPTLISFPELIGMFLSFVTSYWDDFAHASSLEAASMNFVMERFRAAPEDGRAAPGAFGKRLMFIDTAVEAERIYAETFAAVAREYSCYVGAGSIALPPLEDEPSKGGSHIRDDTQVWNTAYLFAPNGVCLQRVPKVNLVPGLESQLFDPGPRHEVIPAETSLGRLGTLICFDGFHETLVERYDSLGVDVLLKPSYNQHAWEGASTYDPAHREGENWLRAGCPSIIQGRENIRYGVNAMMVGAVFDDMLAEGLSTISRNTGNPNTSWQDAVLAIASHPAAEEIVTAVVDL
ncbi:MAG: carbon-nitrogen hydrolase family protein [Dehalococcoidia bacterium]